MVEKDQKHIQAKLVKVAVEETCKDCSSKSSIKGKEAALTSVSALVENDESCTF